MSPSLSLQPYVFPDTGQPVRTVTIDGAPWFVASDVVDVLGYTNGRMAIRNLPDRMKSSVTISDGTPGNPNRTIVSEPGVYRLAMRSTLPAAEAFQDWLAEEVIPSIRRTGRYEVAPATPAVPTSFAEALELAARQARELEAAREQVSQLAPAADAWDALAAAEGDYALREAAQLLARDPSISIGQKRLAAYLREIGWTDRTGQPYQRHVDLGRLARRTRTYEHPHTREEQVTTQLRITARGVRELRDRLTQGAQLTLGDVS
ncbi:BRO family protein [Nocardiopsis sp. FR26]|uniref:BRO family protein n=1 Tax=Nocardiopsis sp. FR26 TaxID=2605987 RepID=UPI00135AA980|nr:BRO family protein [Nocardiopsis sp. FR26]